MRTDEKHEKPPPIRKVLHWVPHIVRAAVRLWVNPPRLRGYRLIEDKQASAQVELVAPGSRASQLPLEPGKSRIFHNDPLRLLYFQMVPLNEADPPNKSRQTICIAVNLRTRRLSWSHTTPEPFAHERQGSGKIEGFFLSLPVTIFASPLLLGLNGYFYARGALHGMSRHSWEILQALRGVVDQETEDLLHEAFRNTWEYDHGGQGRVSFEQAQGVLQALDQIEYVPAEEPGTELPPPRQVYQWHDSAQTLVASGHIDPALQEFSVRVLDTHFVGQEACILAECYRHRKSTPASVETLYDDDH